jgi:hypothetical protein
MEASIFIISVDTTRLVDLVGNRPQDNIYIYIVVDRASISPARMLVLVLSTSMLNLANKGLKLCNNCGYLLSKS